MWALESKYADSLSPWVPAASDNTARTSSIDELLQEKVNVVVEENKDDEHDDGDDKDDDDGKVEQEADAAEVREAHGFSSMGGESNRLVGFGQYSGLGCCRSVFAAATRADSHSDFSVDGAASHSGDRNGDNCDTGECIVGDDNGEDAAADDSGCDISAEAVVNPGVSEC